MALNLTQFKADLKAALLRAQAKNQVDDLGEHPAETAMENLANEIATEVDKYIKTATVKTEVDVTSVNTTVAVVNATPLAPGPVTGTGTGTGSGNGVGYLE